MKIEIYRLDYRNPSKTNGRSFPVLPNLYSLDTIDDVNEVHKIYIFGTSEEIDYLLNVLPKSHGWRKHGYIENRIRSEVLSVRFNTFWMDGNTGQINESAVNRRKRTISRLSKELKNKQQ